MVFLCNHGYYLNNYMLYLFGSGSWKNDRKILKVGYTGDISTREQGYKLHNPLGEILDTREGDEILELKLHLRLKDYKVEFLDEWFHAEDPVFDIFNHSEEDIDKWLWENRGEIFFESLPAIGTLKREILDDLKKKYGEKINTSDKSDLEALKFL